MNTAERIFGIFWRDVQGEDGRWYVQCGSDGFIPDARFVREDDARQMVHILNAGVERELLLEATIVRLTKESPK